jgi:hypothetical protein
LGRVGLRSTAVDSTTGAHEATGWGPNGTFSGARTEGGEGGRAGSAEDGPDDPPTSTTATAAPISNPASPKAAPNPLRCMDGMRLTP